MYNKNLLNKNNIYIACILYISLIIGFIFDENLNGGARPDWLYTNLPAIKDFSESFFDTFLNYDKYNHRHSPIYLIFLSFISKIGVGFDTIRFLHLNISLLLIYFFFKGLTLKFKNFDKNVLFLISISIFLSPTFRSLSIWPDSRIIGLIFFTISIYEFLKFNEKKHIQYFYKTLIYLIIASYVSPNFSVFIIFYYFNYLRKVEIKHIILSFLICMICSLPALYYLFILDINFIIAYTPGANINELVSLDFNLSNKILIISSIIFFHLIPFLINKKFLKEFIKFLKKKFFIIFPIFLINLYFFDYIMAFTGGGFFFQLSNLLFNNNIIFYLFSFLSLLVITYLFIFNLSNILLYSLLILSNIQNTIYHKYYDPLVMIIFFLITFHFLPTKFLLNKRNLIILYLFYSIFISARTIKYLVF